MQDLERMIRQYAPKCEQEEADRERMLEYIAMFPGNILTRENNLCHFTASGWVTNHEHTKVLMIWHNIYRSWAWTGGHADGEADLLSVARREVGEETGLIQIEPVYREPVTLEILTVPGHIKRGAFVSPHLHLNLTFLFCADDKAVLREKPDENSGVRWFSPDGALQNCSEPMMLPIYRKCNASLL